MIWKKKNVEKEQTKFTEQDLKRFAELLKTSEGFLNRAACDSDSLSMIKNMKKGIKKYLRIVDPKVNLEKLNKHAVECYAAYEEIMKKIDPYFCTREKTAQNLNKAYREVMKRESDTYG